MSEEQKIGIELDLEKEEFAKSISEAQAALNRISGAAGEAGKKLKDFPMATPGMIKFGSAVGQVGKHILTMWASVKAITTAITVGMLKASMREIDELAKLSYKLDVSTEAIASLQHISELTGESLETFTGSLQRLQVNLNEAREGTGRAADAMRGLGLDAGEIISMEPDQAFYRLADAIGTMSDRGLQAEAAMSLFGRSGLNLLGVMRSTSGNFQALAEEARALGLTFSQQGAAGVEEFNDSVTRLKGYFVGISRQIAIDVAPSFTKLTDAMRRSLQDGGSIKNMFEGFTRTLVRIADHLREVIDLMDAREASENFIEAQQNVNASLGNMGAAQASMRRELQALTRVFGDSASEVTDYSQAIDFLNARIAEGNTSASTLLPVFTRLRTEYNRTAGAIRGAENALSTATDRLNSTLVSTGMVTEAATIAEERRLEITRRAEQQAGQYAEKVKALRDALASLRAQSAEYVGESLEAEFINQEDAVKKLIQQYRDMGRFRIISATEVAATIEAIEEESSIRRASFVETTANRNLLVQQGYALRTANQLATQNQQFNQQVQEMYNAGTISAESMNYYQRTMAEETAVHNVQMQQQMTAAKESALRAQFGLDSRAFVGAQMLANAGAQLMSSKNAKLFKVGQVASVANIAMSTAEAIMKGYAMLGPFGGSAYAALMGTVSLMQAREVMKQSPPKPVEKVEVQPPSFAQGVFDIPYDMHGVTLHKNETVIPPSFTDSLKKGELSLGAGSGGTTIIHVHGSVIDTQSLLTIIDEHTYDLSRRTGKNPYSVESLYR